LQSFAILSTNNSHFKSARFYAYIRLRACKQIDLGLPVRRIKLSLYIAAKNKRYTNETEHDIFLIQGNVHREVS